MEISVERVRGALSSRYHEMRPLFTSLVRRLWDYLKVRFPLTSQGALIILFALSCVCFGALARGEGEPEPASILVAILVELLLFFQLRVCDEHRDFEEDKRLRPHLPVPAGVIKLEELDVLALGAAGVQFVVTWALHPPLLAILFACWAWILLVRADFFAKDWLEKHPAVSLALHLGFIPWATLYAVGSDQLLVGDRFGGGMFAFLALAICSAALAEIARKCLAPEQEKPGIMSYSAVWGVGRAGMACALLVAVTLLFAGLAFVAAWAPQASEPGAYPIAALAFFTAAGIAFATFISAVRYASDPTKGNARQLLLWVGGWITAAFLFSGLAPFLIRYWP